MVYNFKMKFTKKFNVFWNTINFEEYIRLLFKGNSDNFLKTLKSKFKENNIYLTSSGRGAIQVSLKVLKIKRNDQVLIPAFLSSCVIDSITSVGTPSLDFSEKTKAILLYHHWGFMQDMYSIKNYIGNRNIPIIEDCANTFWGKLGSFEVGNCGDLSTFSLSKIFKITYCGLVKVNQEKLNSNVKDILSKKVSLREYIEHIKGELTYLGYCSKSPKDRNKFIENLKISKWYSYLLSSPTFKDVKGELPQDLFDLEKTFNDMNAKFLLLLNAFKNKEFILENDDINQMAPICYPFLSEDINLLNRIVKWLRKYNIYVDIYNFDINRNIFNPNYKKCVPLPLYKGIDIKVYKDFIFEFSNKN